MKLPVPFIALRRLASGSKAWIQRQRNDHLVQQAKDQDLRARSAFKLQEIQSKHKFITPSSVVLDLGASPGGWSTIASKIVQPAKGGLIIAVDLLAIEPIPHTIIIQGDFTSNTVKEQLRSSVVHNVQRQKASSSTTETPASPSNIQVDVILSDMLHNTTGVADTDHYKSMHLVRQAIQFAIAPSSPVFPQGILKPKGSVVCKFLRGEEEKELIDDLKKNFHTVEIIKPKSSRSESREAFLFLQKRKL